MSIEAPRLLLLTTSLTLCLSGCGWQMAEQPRYDAYEPMAGREDVTSARRPPEGTIRFRHSEERPELSEELLSRGEERYNIYCALCHGRTGHGDGQIVERGFPQPPSFHTKELQQAGDLHYWSAITNGAGRLRSLHHREFYRGVLCRFPGRREGSGPFLVRQTKLGT